MSDHASSRDELRAVVTLVRRRWRLRAALRGAAIVLAVLVGWLVVGGYLLDAVRFSPAAILALRTVGYLTIAATVAWYFVRPVVRRVTDEQVALYIEEHEPGLGTLVVSAVEQASVTSDAAPGLAESVVASAVRRMHERGDGRPIDRRPIQQAGGILGGLLTAGALFLALGSPAFRQAARTLLLPWEDAAAATPYAVMVEPGNATVPRGGDQEIIAHLRGFTTSDVEILYRAGDEPEWQRVPMASDDSAGAFVFRLFDVNQPTEYVVEANGVRSALYRLNVADLPAVENFVVEVRFPSHTGLPTERQDPGGDIVAPHGSRATFAVSSTMPTPGGRLITTAGDTVALTLGEGGVLEGALALTRPGTYRFELQTTEGRYIEASLGYRIDLVDDRGPTVVIRKPGRDAQATAVEEVLAEAEAYDDFGIKRLAFHFRVNGGEERTVVLSEGTRAGREVSAGHTLFLEEWQLQPGDVITYFAEATDNSPGEGQTATSDMYFLRIRPFGKDYRQAEQSGMPGQPGGESPEGLSERQRQIVAATFKVNRDKDKAPEDQTREDLATLALSQGQLRERVVELTQQMARRNAAQVDSSFAMILNALTQAAPAMTQAEEQLGQRDPAAALPLEEKALVHLQRAEEAYREVQVSQGQQQGGGQGGSQANAEELADLFELETDKLRNQYETLERSQQRQAEAQLDETLDRLKQLASRQQQENERLQRAAQNLQQQGQGQGQAGGSAGGAQQRRMAAEAEELARQLERLAREQGSPEAAEAARQMRNAAEAMQRSASGQAGSQAQGEDAADRLRQATRSLESGRNNRTEQAVSEAQQRAQELAEREREIGRDVERALRNGGAVIGDQARSLGERKDSLAADVAELEAELDRLARETGGERPEAGRRLTQAAGGLRDDRVQDKIRFSKGLLRGSSPDYARNFEEQIATNLDSAAARIGAAAGAVQEANAADPTRALEQAGRLVRGLESLRNRAEEARQAQQGQGAEGREGQGQGQEGQGQQGQGQQGQGQQGQQGQGQGQGQGQQGGDGQRQQGGQADPNRPGGGRPGWVDPSSARQLGRELTDRRRAADSLMAEVERLGFDGGDLRDIVAELRRLENGRLFNDPSGLERLERDVLERLKAFEFALRRQVDGDAARPLVGPSDQVPPRFRALVEEYYRSLARGGRTARPPG